MGTFIDVTNIKKSRRKITYTKSLKRKKHKKFYNIFIMPIFTSKNVETQAHTQKLVRYSIEIVKYLGIKTSQLYELELVTKLHDIVKTEINKTILLKKRKLIKEEFKEMKTHMEKGYRILHPSNELSNIDMGVLMHHERYDVRGYSLGLKGKDIPLIARIVNTVDSYEVMITDWGYNKVKIKKNL